MKSHQNLTAIAFNQLHSKKQVVKWVVKSGKTILYESKDYGLCDHFCKIHCLKLKPIAIYN